MIKIILFIIAPRVSTLKKFNLLLSGKDLNLQTIRKISTKENVTVAVQQVVRGILFLGYMYKKGLDILENYVESDVRLGDSNQDINK